jgi:dephospho-CoA kinase
VHLVLGLTGPNASGKGEAAAFLGTLGFEVHSLSDVVRDEARIRGLGTERANLIQVGNDLRRAGGPGVLAERIVARLTGRSVVDSIRNPAEVQVLRGLDHFVLLWIRAPAGVRFERTLARGRAGDARTLEEFEAVERKENASDPAAQRLQATFELADHVVENGGSIAELHARLSEIVRSEEGHVDASRTRSLD